MGILINNEGFESLILNGKHDCESESDHSEDLTMQNYHYQ